MNASKNKVVELQGIDKVFCTDDLETHALSGVDLTIREGEFVAIAGPSGCGKSTLLSILGLLEAPTRGSYELGGHAVSGLGVREKARIRSQQIGFVFQSFNLIGELTVRENVELPLRYGLVSPKLRKERVDRALDQVGMAHRDKHYPTQLSGGQQQRVAVARAVVSAPALLLADEPTGNLDSVNGEAVMGLLLELHRAGSTLCMVTHDPRFLRYAERSVRLFDGRIVSEGVHDEDRRVA
jgi:putative ABC transport system ATP-binding protein